MRWEDILKTYTTISINVSKSNYNTFMDFVIVSLYVLHPPVRADYANMKFFIDDSFVPVNESENYCVLQTNPRFVFNKYKTAKHNGTTVIHIESELHDILLDWAEINTSNYLLSSYTQYKNEFKPFSENTLSKRITSIFMKFADVPVTINTLRHSFVSFMSKNDQEYTQKQNNAAKMMHSISMADKYRRMVYLD
jgi:integrase